jgi:hypothetical protein
MTSLLHTHPFCRFCAHVKEQSNEALRTLCHRHDLNAEVLLFCYWFAENNQGLLSKSQVKLLLAAIYAWHQKIVSPLDRLCKQLTESIAYDVWTLEDSPYPAAEETLLAAAQIEQMLLADILPKKTRRNRPSFTQITTHACLNVSTYCRTVYVSLDEPDYTSLAAIATAVFPETDTDKARSFIRNTLHARQNTTPVQKKLPLFSSEYTART